MSLRVAVLGSTGGWHAERLERALTARGHSCAFVPVTRMVGRIGGGVAVGSGEVALEACDVVVVRGIPRGSLEQVVFRVDALHALAAAGVRVVNPAPAIERTVDKFLASALLAAAGVPTPRTVACERADDALAAFADLGSDVIVKPLFGSMGFGMARVDDPDVAQRVFRALEIERAVYYLQETIPTTASTSARSSSATGSWARSSASATAGVRTSPAAPTPARSRSPTSGPRCACARPGWSGPTTPASTCCAGPTAASTCSRSTASPAGRASRTLRGWTWRRRWWRRWRADELRQLQRPDRPRVQGRRHERAGGARVRERAEVGGVANAAAREQPDLRAPRAQRREQMRRPGPRPSRRARGR